MSPATDSETIPMPEAASSAILVRDGRILMIRRRNPPSCDMYAFPGGRAEPGETPEETAIRELREETGLDVTRPRLFATYDLETRGADGILQSHYFLSVFLVDACDDRQAALELSRIDEVEVDALGHRSRVSEGHDPKSLRAGIAVERLGLWTR